MAGQINYDYDINQDIYVIDVCERVSYVAPGNVRLFEAQVNITETTVAYSIRLDGGRGTKTFAASEVFATKADAMTEYDARIL